MVNAIHRKFAVNDSCFARRASVVEVESLGSICQGLFAEEKAECGPDSLPMRGVGASGLWFL